MTNENGWFTKPLFKTTSCFRVPDDDDDDDDDDGLMVFYVEFDVWYCDCWFVYPEFTPDVLSLQLHPRVNERMRVP